MSKMMKVFIIAIVIMGMARFVLSVRGVPNEITKYFSMTVIILAGSIYFGIATPTHKGRLKAAYLLVVPYMIVEVLALGYTWITGRQTIFHAAKYSLGTSIAVHTIGHLVGGLTWEPLFGFLTMEIIWWLYTKGKQALVQVRNS